MDTLAYCNYRPNVTGNDYWIFFLLFFVCFFCLLFVSYYQVIIQKHFDSRHLKYWWYNFLKLRLNHYWIIFSCLPIIVSFWYQIYFLLFRIRKPVSPFSLIHDKVFTFELFLTPTLPYGDYFKDSWAFFIWTFLEWNFGLNCLWLSGCIGCY